MDDLRKSVEIDVRAGSWIGWPCALCGEESQLFVDPSGGGNQVLVEDCSVCCSPNLIRLAIIYDADLVSLMISPE